VVNLPAVVAEHTPNPDAIKFLLGRVLLDQPYDFRDVEAASVSPLASPLFALAGVQRVFIGPDFAVVTKRGEASWSGLADPVIRALRAFLASGEPAVDPEAPPSSAPEWGEEAARLERVLDAQIQPLVAMHGGDVELISYAGGVARLALRGACAGCPASEATLREQIERRLRAEFPDLVRVEQS
jgi:Fe-S cluster biogenesis protein NfuA